MQERLVVYTVVMGERRKVSSAVKTDGVDWVIVTDVPGVQAAGWTTVEAKRVLDFDSPRSSRHPKMLPFDYFPNHSRSLYIDSNVRLKSDPRALWDFLIGKEGRFDFGAAFQSFRLTLDDEFQAVRDLRLDAPASIEELYSIYLDSCGDELGRPITWGGILARRHGVSALEHAMRDWFFLTLRTSRRDQLTLPLALKNHPDLRFKRVHLDNRSSQFHQWPASKVPKSASYRQYRFPESGPTSPTQSTEKLLAQEIARLRKSETAALRELQTIRQSRSWRIIQVAIRLTEQPRRLRAFKRMLGTVFGRYLRPSR